MNYSEPQLNIHQVFEPVLDTDVTPLHSCVIGPKYGLHRYGVAGEEESVGAYDPSIVNTSAWPNKAAGSTVDQDSAKVFAQNALLKYYGGADFEVPVAGDGGNIVSSGSLVLQSKNGFSRSAVFGNRDVAVGDKIKLTQGSNTVDTIVIDLKGELGSTIGSPVADDSNQIDGLGAVAPNVVSEDVADAALTLGAEGTYDGLADGYIEETYTVKVTAAGAPGTAKASVLSTSGTDDVTEITLEDDAAIGTRGILLSIADSGGGVFAVGETIVITARQAYTAPTITEGGEYTGTKGTTYVIQITEGGVVGTDTPKFKAVTDNGYDIQGVTDITAAAAVLGNYGATITFSGQLVKGDVWYIEATPASENAIKTVVTAANLTGFVAGPIDEVILMIEDTVQIDNEYVSTTETDISVSAGAGVDDTYGDTGTDLPILEGELYIEYRELLNEGVEFGSVSDITELEDILGPAIPANKLSYGVYKGLQNSNGVAVYYCSIPSDDIAGYTEALDRISIEESVWGLVPLNKEADVLAVVETFINTQSNELNNNWKKGWFNSNAEQETAFYTEEAGTAISASIEDDSGNNTNFVNVHATAETKFKTNVNGTVLPGDILRYNPRPVEGVTVWDTAVIAEVTGETTLTLKSSAADLPNIQNIEIWRVASLQDYASIIAAESSAFGNRRINNVWPDTIPNELGEEVEGYYLCAALAAYRSSAAPHQPLTRAEISGFGSPSRTLQFSRSQLNIMAAGGTWIVTSNLTGAVFTRHQLTTDMTDENTREDSVTSNLDSISRVYRDSFEPLIGKSNVTPDMLELIEGRIFTAFKFLHNLPYPRTLGPQIIGYELVELSIDPVIKSKVRIRIKPELPLPLNYIDLYFLVGGEVKNEA